jgi:acetyl esterase/lipase
MLLVRNLVAVLLLPIALGAHAKITPDIIYGHKDGMALTYDVIATDNPNGAGVLFMVSGGWFSIWRPPEERVAGGIKALLDAGFTVFAIHHGSAPRFKVPEAVSDVRAAVRHVHVHAADYGVDAKRLGVFGGSAGGHLSLMLGLNAEGPATQPAASRLSPKYSIENGAAADIAAIVAYFPPADIRNSVGKNERFPALDFPVEQAPAISPILVIDKQDPPTLLVHGDADTLVPLNNSERLAAEMSKAGVTHNLLVIEGAGHGFREPSHRSEASSAMVAWFQTHLTP